MPLFNQDALPPVADWRRYLGQPAGGGIAPPGGFFGSALMGGLSSLGEPLMQAYQGLRAGNPSDIAQGAAGGMLAMAGPPGAGAARMWKTTAAEEAAKILKHYKDDLFGAIKGIDSHPFWSNPEAIKRIAEIKQAVIESASPKALEKAIKVEQDFRARNGISYSEYQSGVFGNQATHPKGVLDWLEYFEKQKPKEIEGK